MQHSRAAGPIPGRRYPVICTAFLSKSSALLLMSTSCPVNRLSLTSPFDGVLSDSVTTTRKLQNCGIHRRHVYEVTAVGRSAYRILQPCIRWPAASVVCPNSSVAVSKQQGNFQHMGRPVEFRYRRGRNCSH